MSRKYTDSEYRNIKRREREVIGQMLDELKKSTFLQVWSPLNPGKSASHLELWGSPAGWPVTSWAPSPSAASWTGHVFSLCLHLLCLYRLVFCGVASTLWSVLGQGRRTFALLNPTGHLMTRHPPVIVNSGPDGRELCSLTTDVLSFS